MQISLSLKYSYVKVVKCGQNLLVVSELRKKNLPAMDYNAIIPG